MNKGTAQEKVEKDISAASLLPWGMEMGGEKFFLQLHWAHITYVIKNKTLP